MVKTMEELLEEALVPLEEQPYEVPENWVWVYTPYLFDIEYGKNLPTSMLKEDGYPVFGANGQIGYYDEYTYAEPKVLISCRGANSGTVNISLEKSFITNNSLIVNEKVNMSTKFIIYLLEAVEKSSLISGTAQPQITLKAFDKFPLLLIPCNEQQRIVTKIESLFSKIDKAKELIEEVRDQFENRRASMLTKAVRGELTEEWRKNNSQIPVSKLIEYIDKERKTLQENDAKARTKVTFKYKKAVQIDIGGRTKGIEELFEIPTTWEWVSLGQVTWSVSDGPHFSPNYVGREGGIPFISARNVLYKSIDFKDAKYVSREDHEKFIERAKPEVGDVLLTKGGTTGIATTIDTNEEFSIWVHVALLKVIKKFILPEYLRDVLTSPYLYRQSQEQTHGVGNQDLGLTRMIYMALPLPPIEEQKQIVKILDELYEKESKIEELTQLEEQIELLKKSILSKAFRGELGTNDPSEESVIELLKEILSQNYSNKKSQGQ